MKGAILILTEEEQGSLRKVSREALGLGRAIAGKQGVEVLAVVFGEKRTLAEEALQYGADTVLCLTPFAADKSSGEEPALCVQKAVEQHSPGLIIAGASSQGREVCSRLAARLGAPLAQDVIDWESEDSGFFVSRPMYGGRVVARLALRGEPGIVSIRPNVFPEPEPEKVHEGSIETLNLDPEQSRLKVLDKVRQQDQADIAEAEIIVAGGYGAGEEGFQALEALAEKLHGAVGASRSAVDAGWRPVQDQVGQTGKVVSPKLYLACGISGAIQHVTGIATAKTVVAINKDPQAPIFAKADLGVVGNLHEIVPLLTKKLEESA